MSSNKPIPIDDLFLTWSELRLIANSVAELLGTLKAKPHAKALLHCQNRVVEWSERFANVQKTRDEWKIRRGEHEQYALTQKRLLDEDAEAPEPDWNFEKYHLRNRVHSPPEPLIGAWFPPELCWDNCPKEMPFPLPPSVDPPTLCERFAALAAIHDCFAGAQHKINPWNRANDDDSISLEEFKKIVPHADRYDALKDVVRQCEESELCSWKKDYELAPEQEHNKDTLSAWLDEIRKDLQTAVDSVIESADPAGDGEAGDDPGDDAGVGPERKGTGSEWPPDSGLHFRPLEFAYQGMVYRLTGMPHRLFEVIATAQKNLHYNDIVQRVWASQERSPEKGTVRSCLSDLRAALREHGLDDLAKRIVVKDEYWSLLG